MGRKRASMGRRKTTFESGAKSSEEEGDAKLRRRSEGINKRLGAMTYAQLQKMAKHASIPANQKKQGLVEKLSERLAADGDVTRAGGWDADASDLDFSQISFDQNEELLAAESDQEEEQEPEADQAEDPPKAADPPATPYTPSRPLNETFSPAPSELHQWSANKRRSGRQAAQSPKTPAPETPADLRHSLKAASAAASATGPSPRRSPRFQQFMGHEDVAMVSEDEDAVLVSNASPGPQPKASKETDSAIKRRIMKEIDERLKASAAKKKSPRRSLSQDSPLAQARTPGRNESPFKRFEKLHHAEDAKMETLGHHQAKLAALHRANTDSASERTKRLATPKAQPRPQAKSLEEKKEGWKAMGNKQTGAGPRLSKAIRGGRTFAQVAQGFKHTPKPAAKPAAPAVPVRSPFKYHSPSRIAFNFGGPSAAQASPAAAASPRVPRARFTTPKSNPGTPKAAKSPGNPVTAKTPRSILKKRKPALGTSAVKSAMAAVPASPFDFSPSKEAQEAGPSTASYQAFRLGTPTGQRVARTPLGLVPIASPARSVPPPVLTSPPEGSTVHLAFSHTIRLQPPTPKTPKAQAEVKAKTPSKTPPKPSATPSKSSPKKLTRAVRTTALERLLKPTLTSKAKAAPKEAAKEAGPPSPLKTRGRRERENRAPEAPWSASRHRGPLPAFVDTAALPDDVSRHVARMAKARQARMDRMAQGPAGPSNADRSRPQRALQTASARANARDRLLNQRRGL